MSNASMKLVIGTKAWSSWSLRPWLLMRMFDIPFDEVDIALRSPDTAAAIAAYSPSGKIPLLVDGNMTVWDSLAIIEYLSDAYPDKAIWPADRSARAHARCVSAEMHSGFQALRQNCPMDFNARGLSPADPAAIAADVARITGVWTTCLSVAGGPFLFGPFTAADAMYAPVVSRFVTYDIPLPSEIRHYRTAIMNLPAMAEWSQRAREQQVLSEG
jgi:glutathione S-transferase